MIGCVTDFLAVSCNLERCVVDLGILWSGCRGKFICRLGICRNEKCPWFIIFSRWEMFFLSLLLEVMGLCVFVSAVVDEMEYIVRIFDDVVIRVLGVCKGNMQYFEISWLQAMISQKYCTKRI